MTYRRWVAGIALAVVAAGAAVGRGDQVVLKNGDKLDGHITTLDGGKLTINVAGLGDVKVDMGQVVTFQTDLPVDLRMTNGTAAKQKIDEVATGGVVVEGGQALNRQVALTDLKQINPPVPEWTGSIQAGALLIRGNSDTDSLNLGANLTHKTEQDDVSVVASYLYGRTKDRTTNLVQTTTENWQVEARYDYNFTPRFYGFADGLVRKDRVAFLDLRVVPSAGLGYKFFDTDSFKLSGELGVAWVYEKYTNNTPEREDISGRAAYHVTKKFNDVLSAFHDLEFLQSVQHVHNFNVNTDLGVHAQLTKHLFGEAKITWDYDSSPANNALKNDMFYALSVGYNL